MKTKQSLAKGFTLLEVLIVVAIIAILSSLLLAGVSAARRSASMAKEINAARTLMGAYAAYAASNDGALLPGYGNFPAQDDQGNALGAPVNSRWPWRLAPYFNYEMRILWGNGDDDQLSRLSNSADRSGYIYRLSVEPALGMNTIYVGGDYQTMDPTAAKAVQRYGQFCVTRLVQASNPGKLVVFASGAGGYQDGKLTGYFKVQAPNFMSRNWANQYSKDLSADSYGNVDFRFGDKAIVAMLDGHVELLDFEHLNDMRYWSNQAAELNSPDWVLGQQ